MPSAICSPGINGGHHGSKSRTKRYGGFGGEPLHIAVLVFDVDVTVTANGDETSLVLEGDYHVTGGVGIESIERIRVYYVLDRRKLQQINALRSGDFLDDLRRGIPLVLPAVCDSVVALHSPPYKTAP